jgi:hypothetical protein
MVLGTHTVFVGFLSERRIDDGGGRRGWQRYTPAVLVGGALSVVGALGVLVLMRGKRNISPASPEAATVAVGLKGRATDGRRGVLRPFQLGQPMAGWGIWGSTRCLNARIKALAEFWHSSRMRCVRGPASRYFRPRSSLA